MSRCRFRKLILIDTEFTNEGGILDLLFGDHFPPVPFENHAL